MTAPVDLHTSVDVSLLPYPFVGRNPVEFVSPAPSPLTPPPLPGQPTVLGYDVRRSSTQTKQELDLVAVRRGRLEGGVTKLCAEDRKERRRRFHKEHTKRSRARMNEKVQRLLMSLPQPEKEEDRPKCKPEVLEYAIGVIKKIRLENQRMKEHIAVLEAALGC